MTLGLFHLARYKIFFFPFLSLSSLWHTHRENILLIWYIWNFLLLLFWLKKKYSVLLRGKVTPFLQLIFIWFILFFSFWFFVVLLLILKQIFAIYCPIFSLIQRSYIPTKMEKKIFIQFFFQQRVCEWIQRAKKNSVHSFFPFTHSFYTVNCVVSFYLNKVAFVDCIVYYRKQRWLSSQSPKKDSISFQAERSILWSLNL